MARLKFNEFLDEIKKYTGDRTDDDTLKIVEDATDTLAPDPDAVDWEGKYNDLAKKYKDRFSEPVSNKEKDDADGSDDAGDGETDAENVTVDDLFKED